MKKTSVIFAIPLLAMLCGSMASDQGALPETGLEQTADPVLVAAGDIAHCSRTEDEATALLLDGIDGTVVTLGDNAYPDGTLANFNDCYETSWGRHKARTRPTPGNHDYHDSSATGYYTYFGAAASPLEPNCTSDCLGYYSYDLGDWHIIALNSEIDLDPGSAQEQWLRADLAAHPNECTLAYWHQPLFSSGKHGNDSDLRPLWEALYEYGADVVLNSHDHSYERFGLQNPSGQADPAHGIREFVVGTGGAGLYEFSTIQANSEVRENNTWGVLKLTLHPTSYDWEFIPIAGQTFTDAGSADCVSAAPVDPELIFADDFESGDLLAWSDSKTDDGDLSPSEAAALEGSLGLQAVIDDDNPLVVEDTLSYAEPRYQVQFHFDPNSISMADEDTHYIFYGYTGEATKVLRLQFRRYDGMYQVRARVMDDSEVWTSTDWLPISDAPHLFKMDWRAATAEGANDGSLALWINEVQQASLTGVDNDTHSINRVRMGAVSGIDAGTRGTYYFDAFESRR